MQAVVSRSRLSSAAWRWGISFGGVPHETISTLHFQIVFTHLLLHLSFIQMPNTSYVALLYETKRLQTDVASVQM